MDAFPHLLRRRGLLVVGALTILAASLSTCLGAGQNGRIVARGRMLDADTRAPLDGVELRIRRASFSLIGRDFARVDHDVEHFDGEFEVSCWRCRAIEIDFSKPGHHPRRISLSLDPDDTGSASRRDEDLEVALVAEGEVVRLERYSGILRTGAADRRVLPVELGETVRALSPERVSERAERLGRPEATAQVALSTATDAEGQLVVVGDGHALSKPERAWIDFGRAGGGAIPYEPQAFYAREIDVEMREAPAAGYEPILALDPEADRTRYLYVKIGERHGRGQVGPVYIERTAEGPRAAVSIELLLSPEPGSRNLETR